VDWSKSMLTRMPAKVLCVKGDITVHSTCYIRLLLHDNARDTQTYAVLIDSDRSFDQLQTLQFMLIMLH
jgi:hypothetical protein